MLGWSCRNKKVHLVVEKVVLTWGTDAVQVPKGHLSSDAMVKKDQAVLMLTWHDKAVASSDKKTEFFLASSVSPSVVATETIPVHLHLQCC